MKENLKKIFTILAILSILTGCTKTEEPIDPDPEVVFIDHNYFNKYKWIESKDDEVSLLVLEPNIRLENFSVLNNKKMVTESSRFIWVPGRMPKPEGKGTYEMEYLDSVEKFSVALKDPSTDKIIHEIDLVDFLNENSDYKLASTTVTGYKADDGLNYISLSLYRLTSQFENNEKVLSETIYRLLINPSNSDLTIVENKEHSDLFSYVTKGRMSLIASTNIASQNGIEIKYGYYEDVHWIIIDRSMLPQNNSKLKAMFPDLSENISSSFKDFQNEEMPLSFYFFDPKSSFEVLSYFIEDDKEIVWDGVKLSELMTVDGIEHEIHSIDDFIEFYKYTESVTIY